MHLLRFIVFKRAQAYFSIRNNGSGLLYDGLLAALFSFYAVALAFIFAFTASGKKEILPEPVLLQLIGRSLLLTPLLFRFFPAFRLKSGLIGSQYPQPKWVIALLDLTAMGFLRTKNAICLLFLVLFCLIAKGQPPRTGVTLLLSLTTGILAAENILNALTWRKYFQLFSTVVLLGGLFWPGLFHSASGQPRLDLILGCTVAALTCFYFLYYRVDTEEIAGMQASDGPVARRMTLRLHCPTLLLIARNRNFVLVLAIAIFFKSLVMATFVFTKGNTLGEVIDRAPFMICLISPAILFTYIYNNLWGYLYPVALHNLLSGTAVIRQIRLYCGFLMPALLLDFMMTSCLLLLGHMFEGKFVLTYLSFSALSIPIGIISSFQKYSVFVLGLDLNRMRAKTSRLFAVVLISAAFLLGFVYNQTPWLTLVLGIFFLVSVLLLIYIKRKEQRLLRRFKLDFFN